MEPLIYKIPDLTDEYVGFEDAPRLPMRSHQDNPIYAGLTGLGLRTQQHIDGVSLKPLLEGETLTERDLFGVGQRLII